MKYISTFTLLLIASLVGISLGQTAPSSVPTIAGCPSPIPSGISNWPASTCKYNFYPLSDTTHAIASISQTNPIYQHTYPSYLATQMIVACPAGAVTSGSACTDSNGKDATVVVAKSVVPSLAIAPTTPDYTAIISYTIEQSYDGGNTWDTVSTTIAYPPQAMAHCFRITAHRKDGDGLPLVGCPTPK